jgi:hypothetical protein
MKYSTKLFGKATIIDTDKLPQASLSKIKAAATDLGERGKFPEGVVSQPDVLALQSVILTTGRPGNLNDDVMLNEEILPVLFTASLKPFNVEHSKLIIGTIFDAFAINRDTGKVVPALEKFNEAATDDEREAQRTELMKTIGKLPERLDIITNQVLWALHFPREVSMIKNRAIGGDMFVSMELWFANFDFLVGNRVVKRTPETAAILDDKLRINGGTGFLGLDKVKRIPRDVTFAGNAAVETPANPDSFILDVMDRSDLADKEELINEEEETVEASARVERLMADNTVYIFESLSDIIDDEKELNIVSDVGRSDALLGTNASSDDSSLEIGEVVNDSDEEKLMETNERIVELVQENAVLQHKTKDAEASLAEANKANEELQGKNTELEARLEEALEKISVKEAELTEKAEAFEKLNAEKAELDSKLEDTSAKLAEIEEARKLDTRKATLAELGLEKERIARTLAKTAELDDEAFDAEVNDLKAFMDELNEKNAVEETPAEETLAEEVTDEAAASEEELEEVLAEVEEEEVPAAAALANAETEEDGDEDSAAVLQGAFAKAMGVKLDA